MNEINYIIIKQKDGYKTKVTHYSCTKRPKGSILILHGMAEHQKRYQDFAEFLVGLGYDVYFYNHRGHGTDKKLNELGYFALTKGYQLVVNDAITISNYIEKNNRCNKFFLFGHSMGSLIARNIIQVYDNYNGVILSGTTHPLKLLTYIGLILSTLIKKIKGPKHYSPYLKNLMFGSKKYTKLTSRTAYDWLSRSNPVVGAYIHDPYCGFICTTSCYQDILRLAYNATKKRLIKLTKKELPLHIISGDKDPVGGYGKEIKKFSTILKSLGFKNVTYKLYPESRHELLNELNNEEVYQDIQHWLSKRV